jgi:hypothetical protein
MLDLLHSFRIFRKVTQLVAEINLELVSLQRQMDKIEKKIPIEESDLLRMMDTSEPFPIHLK